MYYMMKLFLSFSLFLGGINGVIGSNQLVGPKNDPKLFVFGDCYADTGNMMHDTISWKSPYGITYPGKPSGRYSDGLIATDFLAKTLGAKSPYLWSTHDKKKRLNRGMNFAYGRANIIGFHPKDPVPNITRQVDLLVDLFIARRVYTFDDLTSSDVALLSYAGRDYFDVVFSSGTKGYENFVTYIMGDIQHTLWKLDGLTFKNIAITSLPPIGCYPEVTFSSSFQRCNETYNVMVELHNKMLKEIVAKLNEEAKVRKKGQRFFIIDLHKAFMTILNKKGNTRFKTPLKPCCEGDCGSVGDKGVKKYTLCNDPKSAFFWDKNNPTQEGWRSICSVLGNPLRSF